MVRHAQASLGAENYDQLSELGYQQARWLGDYLADAQLQFDHVFCGNMARHRQTLEGIRQALGSACPDEQIMPGLDEFDFKALVSAYRHCSADTQEPQSIADYYRLLKQALQAWSQDQLGHQADGSPLPETWQQFQQRVSQSYQHIQTLCSGKVLVVSSGGANAMWLSQVLQAPQQTMIELNLQSINTGLSHFFFNRQAMRLSQFNSIPHLDTAERRKHITYG